MAAQARHVRLPRASPRGGAWPWLALPQQLLLSLLLVMVGLVGVSTASFPQVQDLLEHGR